MVKVMPQFNLDRKTLLITLLVLAVIVTIPILALNYDKIRQFFTKPELQTQESLLGCPTNKEFCQNSQDITFQNAYLGFGGTLSENEPLYAAFDGSLKAITTTMPKEFKNEKINTINIDSADGTMRAVYYFIGQAPSSQTVVKQGQIIGKITGKITSFNTSLVFQLIKGDPIKGDKVKLTSEDFVK